MPDRLLNQRVTKCGECPCNYEWRCRRTMTLRQLPADALDTVGWPDNKVIENGKIPKWCPLPKVKEAPDA